MHKLLLIIAITFNFCNGMEPQEKRVYNPEATEKLREILNTTRLNDFSPPMEKLISCIPQFLSDLIISPKPLRLRSSWPQEIETLVKQGADPNINLNSSRYQNLLTNPLSLALDNFR